MGDGITYSCRTEGVSDTKRFAASLAPYLSAGDVVLLTGDLGAGKTQFAQGLASALGVVDEVTSPTFNILLTHQGADLELNHFDLYRLDEPEELEDIGFWDAVEGSGVSLIEWGDKFPDQMPADYLEITVRLGEEDQARLFTVEACGQRPQSLLDSWAGDARSHLSISDESAGQ